MPVRRLIAALSLVLLAFAAACARDASRRYIRSDDALDARMTELRETRGSAPLRDLTDFDWDAVFTYYEGVSNEEINADVGTTVFSSDSGRYPFFGGALAIFTRNGAVVRALAIAEINFTKGRHSADVILQDGFELVEPPTA